MSEFELFVPGHRWANSDSQTHPWTVCLTRP